MWMWSGWSRELYGVVLLLITTLGIDGNRFIFFRFCLSSFLIESFRYKTACAASLVKGVAESFDTSEAVQ